MPLQLLQVCTDETHPHTPSPRRNGILAKCISFMRASASVLKLSPSSQAKSRETGQDNRPPSYPITFVQLGRHGHQITLYAPTWISRWTWIEEITKQQELINEQSNSFETSLLSELFFIGSKQINCAVPFGTILIHVSTSNVLANSPLRPRSSYSLRYR